MSGVPVGLRAVGLPWLCPTADALVALTSDPPDGAAIAGDPAALAHVLRFSRPTPTADGPFLSTAVLSQPGLCANAATLLESTSDPDPVERLDVLMPLNRVVSTAATIAGELARQMGTVSPDAAVAITRLTALGWWAVASVEPAAADELLASGRSSTIRERHRLGLDVAAIGRRLVARWRLPGWVAATLASVPLSVEDGVRLGAPVNLLRVVQSAVSAAGRADGLFGRTGPTPSNSLTRAAERLVERLPTEAAPASRLPSAGERGIFTRLLRATATARKTSGAVWLARAEEQIDRLSEALTSLRTEFDERVRDAKLSSLAEFAAGASHEINNPLAVISGHAQLLLASESDPDRRKQLGTIIRQTKRIHELLQGTRQYARPPRPEAAPIAVSGLVADVLAELGEEAARRRVDLRAIRRADPATESLADPGQLRAALTHLVRNAIEAVPPGGWVEVSVESRDQAVAICVDDNGPGPDPGIAAHLFDPFFSGRSAGRGRGLGLSIAWRLARINGASVRYRPEIGPATRFELVLRRADQSSLRPTWAERRSA